MGLREYRDICQKNEQENYLADKYIFRKISIFATIIFIKLGLKANHVTFLSLLFALGSLYFLTANSTGMMVAAAVLIMGYYMLDHVDGELARYHAHQSEEALSLGGQYFDLLVHRYSANLMLFFLGISAYNLFGYQIAVVIGLAACVGMSSFPNLVAAHVLAQKIACDPASIKDDKMAEALSILEKKREQVEKVESKKFYTLLPKVAAELLLFPGSLLLIAAAVVLDIFVPSFTISNLEFNIRFLLLLSLTPVYIANTIRQSLRWGSILDGIS